MRKMGNESVRAKVYMRKHANNGANMKHGSSVRVTPVTQQEDGKQQKKYQHQQEERATTTQLHMLEEIDDIGLE